MDVRTLLRASLVPLGVALAMRGIEHMRAEADELGALVAERRDYLAGDGPLPDVDQPAPEDFPQGPMLEEISPGKSAVRRPGRLAALAVGVVGVALAVTAARRLPAWLAEQRADIDAPVPFMPTDHPWNVIRSLNGHDYSPPAAAWRAAEQPADEHTAECRAAWPDGRGCACPAEV